jgi:two-component system, NtrC family, sensor kinase
VLSSFSDLSNWFTRRVEHSTQQNALLRRIVDRIRNSLELNTVLQTAVDETAALFGLDRCLFLWYFKELDQVQVICERVRGGQPSLLAHYPIAYFESIASALETGELVIKTGNQTGRSCWHWIKSCHQPVKSAHSSVQIFGATASLWMPVKVGEGLTGFLACLSDQPRHWSTTEIDFIQSIAQQLEIAIRQAQLYERTQKQAQREQLINQITAQTRQSFDLNTVLTQAIAQLLEAMEVDRCLVHLVEPQVDVEPLEPAQPEAEFNLDQIFRRKHLFEVCRPPFPPSIDDFDTNGPITQWVIQQRQQVVIADITQDARIGPDNDEYRLAQIKSSLVVPVQADGKLLAILYLNQCSAIRYWSKDDQSLAQAIADQLAISIQHGLLYAQMRQQASESAAQAQHLAELLQNLRQAQTQLIQSEKLSSLGQLVAGIAHEINNPISFIYGNIPYIERYVQDLVRLLAAYQSHSAQADRLSHLAEEIELGFLLQDLPRILQSMKSGADRIREIVRSLRSFSHLDEAHCKITDVHQGLDNTLEVLQNQLKPGIEVKRCYGELPHVECYPRLLNQVFVSLLINAIEALDASDAEPKTITIRTTLIQHEVTHEPWVQIAIADNGCGIPEAIQSRIYDPFFTTKSVGQGMGLGLAVSYQTIVCHHQGMLKFDSQAGQGAEFVIEIPVKHPNGHVRDRNQQLPQPQAIEPTKVIQPNRGQR